MSVGKLMLLFISCCVLSFRTQAQVRTEIQKSVLFIHNMLGSKLDSVPVGQLVPDGGFLIIQATPRQVIKEVSVYSSADRSINGYWRAIAKSIIGITVKDIPPIVIMPYQIRGYVDRKREEPTLPIAIGVMGEFSADYGGKDLPGAFLARSFFWVHYGPVE